MDTYRSDFLQAMAARGFIQDLTHPGELDALMATGTPVPAYIGFDATASSLHAGSLVQIMMLRWLQKTGHKPIVLMGGGTTKVGDPTGRDSARKMLSDADIQGNIDGIKQVFQKYLTFGDGPTDAVMVNNADWLDGLNYLAFLRDYGRHFSVNRMLSFDSVKLRLEREQPMSFLEFNYMILQSYDFLELNRRHGVRLQMGGSDQWGNIVNGVELGRRVDEAELFGLTTPLLTKASGEKMGKTADGAVWLNADHLSPYAYWQFWRNTEDADVGRFLKLFTELPMEEIDRLSTLQGAELNEAKKILAHAATALCHGEDAARDAAETARRTFEEGGIGENLPRVQVARAELEGGTLGLLAALVKAGLAASNGEARRQVQGGAVRLNDEKATEPTRMIEAGDITADGVVKLSMGKKRHALLVAE
ncbi:tyrosine--tRNA ligase [Marivibrio halodurans]|uniref:Tyrosine--tRNA ligase n=1 Tax=Marivibrio halodurans TaxID=2039722 RepID=A0A8J7SLS5_9PROT|nr:tyrosine--tRNA ligase [Marivibrio halodurans]MBP5857028.1 tyrosine--tRNA ligase [Marivibrio halodurans]